MQLNISHQILNFPHVFWKKSVSLRPIVTKQHHEPVLGLMTSQIVNDRC